MRLRSWGYWVRGYYGLRGVEMEVHGCGCGYIAWVREELEVRGVGLGMVLWRSEVGESSSSLSIEVLSRLIFIRLCGWWP